MLSWTSWFTGGAKGKGLLLPRATWGAQARAGILPPHLCSTRNLPRCQGRDFSPCTLQFFDRLKLFWMPAKHQPDFIYLRHVPLRKVHLFTLIQLLCLVLLWAIKVSPAAIVFPMMVRAGPFRFAVLW